MRCPFCGHTDTAVKDSRNTDDQSAIRRRRFCQECGSRFTTFERIQLRDLVVIKKDGNRVPFDRDKLAKSIVMALHKRAVPAERIERVISSIVRRLETSGDAEIPTAAIGSIVMEALVNLDAVAYVRFASIYHEFNNVSDFIEFISNMKEAAQNRPLPQETP
ncbi:transcriptional regulator NrdR [Candidatus Odyssella thessalonicensis]|uniref:transcriptional regulator NrdR n=1 Tax=Candidatus Odyssella thessalonicensis TaxID=84647 RepID=UPI000225AED8|nr:transcriptional regulator NrdR [Candidatus Odyssella thessalonicensis]